MRRGSGAIGDWQAPPCFSAIGLYDKTNKLIMPLSSIVEECKVAKVRVTLTIRNSQDLKVSGTDTVLSTSGSKWSAEASLNEAISRLQHREKVGRTTSGRRGLEVTKQERWSKANQKMRREVVQLEVRKAVEEERVAKAVGMAQQWAWTRWESVEQKKLSWQDIISKEPSRLQFQLRSVHDLLPSQVNLNRWGIADSESCLLCGKRGTLEHALPSCNKCLTQGRYTWRHDKTLKVFAEVIDILYIYMIERRKEINWKRENNKFC
jgi:hypothetical protein